MDTPSKTVRTFIAAYYAWNEASNKRTGALDPSSSEHRTAMEAAGIDYDGLIHKLCLSSVVRQGIAFGDRPSHHPGQEIIDSEAVSLDTAIVRTRNVGPDGFVAKYEYYLAKEAEEWRIGSLLYVDGENKYECL